MRSGKQVFEHTTGKRVEDFGEVINMQVFIDHHLPMVVACTGCEMTMSLLSPSVRVDDQDRVWCRSCSGEKVLGEE